MAAPTGALETPALEAAGVSKRYGDRDALCGVDLVVRPGILHGLLGPNGAGKTTLMRVLLGLVRRDAGSIRLLGRDLDSTAGLPDGVAGFVESPTFYPYLSARKNLTLLARLDDDRSWDRHERVGRALEQVGLSAQADVRVGAFRPACGSASASLRRRCAGRDSCSSTSRRARSTRRAHAKCGRSRSMRRARVPPSC
jgi:ABC-2 type transport system ATP-binding protein